MAATVAPSPELSTKAFADLINRLHETFHHLLHENARLRADHEHLRKQLVSTPTSTWPPSPVFPSRNISMPDPPYDEEVADERLHPTSPDASAELRHPIMGSKSTGTTATLATGSRHSGQARVEESGVPRSRASSVREVAEVGLELCRVPSDETAMGGRQRSSRHSKASRLSWPSDIGMPHGGIPNVRFEPGVMSVPMRSANVEALFPLWWNPARPNMSDKGSRRQHTNPEGQLSEAPSRPLSPLIQSQRTINSHFSTRCLLSPVSNRRLLWDLTAACLILYGAWSTPFELIFVTEEHSGAMEGLNHVMLVFFVLDIVLNFNTGLLEEGRIILDRQQIRREYFFGFFWVDFLSTLPLHFVLAPVNEAGAKATRLLKWLRLLRILKFPQMFRYLRLVRSQKALQSNKTSKDHRESIPLEFLGVSLAFLIAMLLLAHSHACFWFIIQYDHTVTRSFSPALRDYIDCFCVVYRALIVGVPIGAGTTRGQHIFEVYILTYPMVIAVGLTTWVVATCVMRYGDRTRMRLKTDNALAYLRRHRIDVQTQLQVLHGLHEAGSAQVIQRDFRDLMSSDLPVELQRTIMDELWGGKLMSLGLIAVVNEWNESCRFVGKLAMLCREEVFATRSVLFREGDSSFCAYYVLAGEVGTASTTVLKPIPDFRPCMWLGENALVNPSYLRGFTAFSKMLCSVMLVPADGFQDLLRQNRLDDTFEQWCATELWRGVCGRCGVVGDHFSDDCTRHLLRNRTSQRSRQFGATVTRHLSMGGLRGRGFSITKKESVPKKKQGSNRELQEFLRLHDLDFLKEDLEAMGVFTLELLEDINMDKLRQQLAEKMPAVTLSALQMKALSVRQIQKFVADIQKGMYRMLDQAQDNSHLLFLSHFKVEAGTEAALMRTELEQLIRESSNHPAAHLPAPIFLDSDDLQSLKDIQAQVKHSQNLALLLTRGVLTRPWCLVELVTAVRAQIPVLLVEVVKEGNKFEYPNDAFYRKLQQKKVLDSSALDVLNSCGITIDDVESCIREVFTNIAIRYSPHRPMHLRRAELTTLLQRCTKDQAAPVVTSSVASFLETSTSQSISVARKSRSGHSLESG